MHIEEAKQPAEEWTSPPAALIVSISLVKGLIAPPPRRTDRHVPSSCGMRLHCHVRPYTHMSYVICGIHIYLSIYLSVYLSIYLSICISKHKTLYTTPLQQHSTLVKSEFRCSRGGSTCVSLQARLSVRHRGRNSNS